MQSTKSVKFQELTKDKLLQKNELSKLLNEMRYLLDSGFTELEEQVMFFFDFFFRGKKSKLLCHLVKLSILI